jgi:hypothetical protein
MYDKWREYSERQGLKSSTRPGRLKTSVAFHVHQEEARTLDENERAKFGCDLAFDCFSCCFGAGFGKEQRNAMG